jgi:hypothetical protein
MKITRILDFIIPRFVVVAAFFDETATSSAVRIKVLSLCLACASLPCSTVE